MRPEQCRAARGCRGAAAAACLLAAASTLAGCSRGLRAAPPALAGGSILAATNGLGWTLLNESTGEAVRNFSWDDDTAVLSPTRERLLTTDTWDRAARLRSASTGEVLRSFEVNRSAIYMSAAFSPTEQHVLIATCCEQKPILADHLTPKALLEHTKISRMTTRDASTGEVLLNFTYHRTVNSADWSPTGDYLLTASDDGIATLWNASTGEALRELAGHSREYDALEMASFSPAGDRVLTASWDETAKMWNASTGEVLRNFTGHTSGVVSAVFSPTGDRVLTASADGTAIVWDASTGEVLQRFTGHSTILTWAVFSPTGDYVLTRDIGSTAKLWNASSGEVLHTFEGIGRAAVVLPKLWAASSVEG